MRRFTTTSVVLLACACALAATGATRASAVQQTGNRKAVAYYTKEIARFRRDTWHWQRVMGARRTPVRVRTLAASSPVRLRHLDAVWRHRAKEAARKAHNPPDRRAWLCIHQYEGSWRDPGAPYYGGLQMDISFQRAYGGWLLHTKGTADHWTPLEQIWTAVRAYRVRGFYPWPNTARYCGLI